MRRVAAAVLLALAAAAPAAAATPDRYTLAGGCWSLPGVAEQVHLQATTLGEYLLVRPDGTFVTAGEPATAPSPAAEWVVADSGGGRLSFTPKEGGAARTTTPAAATGCAVPPEAPLNATGTPATVRPFTTVQGLVEGHMHWMTFEYFGRNFHCGRPWHRYGIAHALPDCSSIEGPQGLGAPFQNFFNFGNPAMPHDTRGYPQLTEWRRDNYTYEGTYWRWVQRAWMGGLRLMVMGVNENRVLCELQANRETNCNEMDTVRRAIADMREMQRYIDAQAGGPGKGFMEIVTDPFAARRVIAAGKMAVVLEIEISEPLDCRGWQLPTCDQKQVDAQLEEMHALGVRSMLLLNKFDNPLTGVRFDGGPTGVIINAGNRSSAGTFFDAQTCQGPLRDNTIETGSPEASGLANSILAAAGVPGGTVPVYPPPPHCNTRGLTDLGKHVVRRMTDLQMIVNPDHMSQAAVEDTLTVLEARDYSGVISPHGWMDPGNWPRIWKLGGMAFPGHSAATGYVEEWREFRPRQTPYAFGWGYGADLGGLSGQPSPYEGKGAIGYPFTTAEGITIDRQTTGERTFDYPKEGVAHYGLYAEWFEDLRRLGGSQLAKDMDAGAEAYLQMWERAAGVPTPRCHSPRRRIGARGLGAVRLGRGWRDLLTHAGQPQQRTQAWTWCVAGKGNRRAADVAVLDGMGRVSLVGSTARGRSARGVRIGARSGRRDGTYRRGTAAFVVRKHRVRAVGVASRSLSHTAVRRAMRRVLGAKATQVRRTYVPAEKRQTRLTGRTLAGTTNPGLNSALAALCRLQLNAW